MLKSLGLLVVLVCLLFSIIFILNTSFFLKLFYSGKELDDKKILRMKVLLTVVSIVSLFLIIILK